MRARRRTAPLPLSGRAAFGLAVGLAILVALWFFDAQGSIRELLHWFRQAGWVALPVFVLLHAAAVVLLLPGIIFPLSAGFLFGPIAGTLVSNIGKTLGSALAFLLARHLLDGSISRERQAKFRDRHPVLSLLERRLPDSGWRMVVLIRLVPIIPYKVSNYFFGWSGFRRRDFILGTFVGSIPFSFTNAWLGSLAADLSNLTDRSLPRSPSQWVLYAAGLILALAAATAITRRARAILRAELAAQTTQEENQQP